MKVNDIFELVIGTALFLIILVGCVVVSNNIIRLFTPADVSKNIRFVVLIVHLIIIVAFVMAIRSFFYKNIKNKDVLNSIFTLTGPIIAISSFYMSDTIKALIH